MKARCLCIVLIAGCSRSQTLPPTASVPPAGTGRSTHAGGLSQADVSDAPVAPSDWTQDPWRPLTESLPWRFVVVHHTASTFGNVESIHQTHLQRTDDFGRPWQGIGYHFVIGNGNGMEDGAIEPTFRWRDQLPGAHAGVAEYNEQGIGICLVGNFQEQPPSEAQMQSLRRLVSVLTSRYGIHMENIVRHQDVKPTACPGRYFPWEELRALHDTAQGLVHHNARSYDSAP